jgi:hypothetical protein
MMRRWTGEEAAEIGIDSKKDLCLKCRRIADPAYGVHVYHRFFGKILVNQIIVWLSLVCSLVALATFAFDLRGRPIGTLTARARAAIAAIFTAIGLGSWYFAPAEKPAATQAAIVASAIPTTTSFPAGSVLKLQLEPQTRPAASRPSAGSLSGPSVIRYAGAEDDELTMLVRDSVGNEPFRGTLERTCTKDDSLEGLIACDLILRVRIGNRAAFSIDARGVNFNERAAERQARERLASAFIQRLEEAR